MEEQFELPVEYKGEQFLFNASLHTFGYTHKFRVEVNGQEIVFEPDEERNYRAVLSYEEIEKHKILDVELLMAISAAIESLENEKLMVWQHFTNFLSIFVTIKKLPHAPLPY